MKIEEKVPVMMPNVITIAKPRSTSPPRMTHASVAATVVPDVTTVRGSVSLILRLRISYRFFRLNLCRFSRTRSNVTIVSFTE